MIPLTEMEREDQIVQEYRPGFGEFGKLGELIKHLGNELGAKKTGIGAIIPPEEWNPNIISGLT